ncbi:ABC transporter ATP-binding protein [Catenulispora subtropica]|uniref:ABC transporter ATP-binding protein n=1 Tax=Catenulispora subtropica TaxID=450798 RepID=A0ABN2SZH7_9ACTN
MSKNTDTSATGAVAGDLRLVNVTKSFGDFTAVNDLTLTIPQGSFFALLGASGCGKTTTLRMVSGLEEPTAGRVLIGDDDITRLRPYKRPVNTVFQNYALFPHLTIADNIAFGLKRRGVKDVRKPVQDMLDLIELSHIGNRKPSQLSGGQQQRVALGRALINRPQVLLLDEPLGALDLKLRRQMQIELKRIQTEVGLTFVHVTHDQEEAMTMADTIAVMNHGRIEQLGSPTDLYENPKTTFVANFLGQSNLLPGKAGGTVADKAREHVQVVLQDGTRVLVPSERNCAAGEEVIVGVRPEKMSIHASLDEVPEGRNVLTGGVVTDTSFVGVSTQYIVKTGASEDIGVFVQNDGARIFRPGSDVVVSWDPSQGFGLDGRQDIDAGAEADLEAAS